MDFRRLRYFRVVADELSFTRAAERLHLAQPPLSRQIRLLEEEIGVTLFERTTRSIKLTEAGRFLHEQAVQLLSRVEEVREATRRIGKSGRRWFGIGFVPSSLYGFMPELIREFRDEHPDVDVGLSEMTTVQQLPALRAGRIDIGIGRLVLNEPGVVRWVVTEEPLVAALRSDHPLSQHKTCSLRDLADQPFILYPAKPRPSYADQVLELARRHRLTLNVVQEANELQTAIGLVAAGLGVTLVPASVARLTRNDTCYRPLQETEVTSPVIVSYREGDTSPLLSQILGWLQQKTQSVD